MKKSLQKKLKNYSMATGALLVAGASTNAQVVYTDVDPDFVQNEPGNYDLDVNNDGVVDFVVIRGSGTAGGYLRFVPMSSASAVAVNGNEALGATSYGAYFLPFALDLDAPIDGSQTVWNGTMNSGMLTMAWGSTYGYWAGGQTDKYVGFRFDVDGSWHYGWARFDAVAGGEGFTLKDYAYESTAGTGILAGDEGGPIIPQADPATNLIASDIGNNHDATDLGISFDAAADETTVAEYRLMVVKEVNATGFDTAAAVLVTADNYLAITPDGSTTYEPTLDAAATDVDGDAIIEDVAYNVFVLSIADGTNAELNEISDPSNAITLMDDEGILESNLQNLKVFVNNKELNIDLGANLSDVVISVYNATGQEVLSAEMTENIAKYNLSDLSSGVYVVRIFTSDEAIAKTIKL